MNQNLKGEKSSVEKDVSLIAACGLYCGVCKKYLLGNCLGCKKNEKASWCKVRKCCNENDYNSCADCNKMPTSEECKKLNNFVSKIFALIFKSNRNACIRKIKAIGAKSYVDEM